MPLSEYTQGSVICSKGEPLENIYFITKGRVSASYNGHSFNFEAGDTIGLCALSTGSHSCTYTAASEVTIVSHPYENFSSLKPLLYDKADVANRLVNSLSRQITVFLQYRATLKREADTAREFLKEAYPQYEHLCSLYAFSSKKIAGLFDFTKPLDADPVKSWLHNYYVEISSLDPKISKEFFYGNTSISAGFFHRGTDDIYQILESCSLYLEYLKNVSEIFLNKDGHDLFALISELHLNSLSIKGANESVGTIMSQLNRILSNMSFVDKAYYKERLSSYQESLAEGKVADEDVVEAPSGSGVKQNLSDSMHVILEYSGCPEELCNKFARLVHDYAKLPDRSSSDDAVYSLRRELTTIFNTLYVHVFLNSLERSDTMPTVVKMFLNFGYVDANLAGHKNADYLYSIADSLKGNAEMDVYTLPEWLTAIYKGHKEPSRNDFDMDYPGHLREMKQMRKIDEAEEARLLKDQLAKLRFELENVFPVVNKITFGRISTFCPLLSDHNMQRSLDASLVTPKSLRDAFDEIRNVDHTAYYRETLYSNPDCGIAKEFVHTEILPEIILMPNIGVRGSMWQEMEGRKHASPARIFMSVFFLNDLKTLITRLTGEFRWEICKRIQGPRWSDFSYPSLTSEFFDYMQFYRSNRELSQEVKSTIKTELVRARNNYKEVFVSNYAEWLTYESKGSPRLNKIARKVLLEYCPFPADIREKLTQNPQFTELFKRHNFKVQQRVRQLQNVIQKVEKSGKKVPQELFDEISYLES